MPFGNALRRIKGVDVFGGKDDQDQVNSEEGNVATITSGAAVADTDAGPGGAGFGSPLGDPTPPPGTPLFDASGDEASEEKSDLATASQTNDQSSAAANVSQNDLLSIKQQALVQLGPLVKHLDQTPEEKFRTMMMMIQANDNQSLVKDAYEAAQRIHDAGERARALLDVINEINYFTQPEKS
jgi:hypothetical protein